MTNKIKMQKGYPTTDGQIHEKHSDAVRCKSDIDFTDACAKSLPDVELENVKTFFSDNVDAIKEYIKQLLTKKPAIKKTGEKTAAKDKTANKKADG